MVRHKAVLIELVYYTRTAIPSWGIREESQYKSRIYASPMMWTNKKRVKFLTRMHLDLQRVPYRNYPLGNKVMPLLNNGTV